MRPLRPQPQAQRTADAETAAASGPPASPTSRSQPPVSATRLALQARAAEMARLDVLYLRHDLRNIGLIAGLMLAIIIGLTFVIR